MKPAPPHASRHTAPTSFAQRDCAAFQPGRAALERALDVVVDRLAAALGEQLDESLLANPKAYAFAIAGQQPPLVPQ